LGKRKKEGVAGVRDGWLAGGQAVLTDKEARPVMHVTLLNTRWIVGPVFVSIL